MSVDAARSILSPLTCIPSNWIAGSVLPDACRHHRPTWDGSLQIESSDPSQVGLWCLQASGRTLPAIQLDGMQVRGARMDRAASTDIVTVVYTAPSGERVTVGWLEGQGPTGSGVEDRNVSGHESLIVHSAVGTAVITGSSLDVMWQTAAAIESTAPLLHAGDSFRLDAQHPRAVVISEPRSG